MNKLNDRNITELINLSKYMWSHLSEQEKEIYCCTVGTLGFIEELADYLKIDLRDIDPDQIDEINDLIIYQ